MNDLDPRVARMATQLATLAAAQGILLRVTETRPADAAQQRDLQDFGFAFRAFPMRENNTIDPDVTSPSARRRWARIEALARSVGLQADVSLFWFNGAPALDTLRTAGSGGTTPPPRDQ